MTSIELRYAFYVDLEKTGDWENISGPVEKQRVIQHCQTYWLDHCYAHSFVENSESTQFDGFLCFFKKPENIVDAAFSVLNNLETELIRKSPVSILQIRPRITLLLAHMSIRDNDYRSASSTELNNALPVEREIGEVGRIAIDGNLHMHLNSKQKALFRYVKVVEGKRKIDINVYRSVQKLDIFDRYLA